MFKNTNILFAIIFCNISYSSESNPLDANEQINEKITRQLDNINLHRMHTIYLLKNSAKYFGPYVEKLVKYAFPSKSKMWDINKTFVKYLTEYKNKMEGKFEDLKKQSNISNDINIYEYNDIFSELTKKCSEYIKDCNNYYNKHKLLYSVYRQKLAQFNTLIGTIQEYMQYFENALSLIVKDNQKLQETRNKIVIDNKNTALN